VRRVASNKCTLEIDDDNLAPCLSSFSLSPLFPFLTLLFSLPLCLCLSLYVFPPFSLFVSLSLSFCAVFVNKLLSLSRERALVPSHYLSLSFSLPLSC
jgi:hypothetical protein